MSNSPPPHVLAAFGTGDLPQPLPGGQGGSFRAGSLVFKPAGFGPEAELTAALFGRLDGPGFRVPRPARTKDGAFVFEGWCAAEFINARHAGPNGGRWPETIAACRAFHAALANEGPGAWQAVFARRTDAWAEADRLAFGEATLEPLPPFRETIGRLERLIRPFDRPFQLIHGDFTANVLFAEGEPPCVIDFSPYWRPVEFALAVVVSDALAWTNADPAIIDLCSDIPDFRHWMARATLRRVWELDQHARRGREHADAYLAEYVPVLALMERSV